MSAGQDIALSCFQLITKEKQVSPKIYVLSFSLCETKVITLAQLVDPVLQQAVHLLYLPRQMEEKSHTSLQSCIIVFKEAGTTIPEFPASSVKCNLD